MRLPSSPSRFATVAAMVASIALPVISLPFAAALEAAAAEQAAVLDTSKLPRMPGATVVFESPQTTILSVSGGVPAAAQASAQALKGAGWIAYVPPSTAVRKDTAFEMMTFKKGRLGLTLMVTSAPAQAGATNVQLTDNPLSGDLPVPADAETVVFDPAQPFVTFSTSVSVRDAFAAFEAGLKTDGWRRWEPAPGQTSPTVEVGDEIARMFFLKAGAQRPLYVTVNAKPGPKTSVKAEPVPPSLLNPPKPEAKIETPSPAEEAARKTHSEVSDAMDKAMGDIANSIMSEVQSSLANGGMGKSAPKAEAAQGGAQALPVLKPMPSVASKFPIPEGAEGLEIGDGTVEFDSPAPVAAVGAFYKTEMKKAGWSQRPSVISRETMDVQTYTQGIKTIDITIMQMGGKAHVSAHGSGFDEEERERAQSDAKSAPAPAVTLEAEDKDGLPVPKPHTMAGREATLFRVTVSATVDAPVATVIAFYREALGKLSWTEDSSKVSEKAATLSFTSPEGPAELSVKEEGSQTTSQLSVRKTKQAEASGLLPKPGKVTLLIGNAGEAEALVKAAGKSIKAQPGIGTKNPDGPKLELDPGQQKIVFEFKGKAESEVLNVKAGEIWGILVAPGGALPMQLY